jgi:mRNA-degrading endonuclease toxin of MazEF toxin-antitoxin module
MANESRVVLPTPRRGEIWTAYLDAEQRQRHWIVIVSLDYRNLSVRAETVLAVPFSSRLVEMPTTLIFQPGETGLPGSSCLRCHFISVLPKRQLIARQPRVVSNTRMREICMRIRRSFDTDAI